MAQNWKCTLEYDGGRYFGWQRQPARPTVQAALEDVLARLLQERVHVAGSGRTDTGVHALGQVASFAVARGRDRESLHRGLNALLPDDVRVLALEEAPRGFHARFDARSKRYEYRVRTDPIAPVFGRGHCWHVRSELDEGGMRVAAAALPGTHDFRAFARKPPPGRSTVRTLRSVDIWRCGASIGFALEADGFLHTMVRSIVGTLVLVGAGKRDPRDVRATLDSRDRSRCGPPAPARGLFLAEVHY